MLSIDIKVIPHAEQRYPTVGDFSTVDGVRLVRVSDMQHDDWEFLVALHELIEQHLCHKRGITDKEIDLFDMQFEKGRPDGNYDEPGDDHSAPYYKAHQFATGIERIMAAELGVDWNEYNAAVGSL